MPDGSIGNTEENLFTRDGRAERWWQRTGSTRGCGCARRESLRVIQFAGAKAQCAQRRGALAQTSPDGPLENAICQTGGGYYQATLL